MAGYALKPDVFVELTPSGAFHALTAPADEPAAQLLRSFLQLSETPALAREGSRVLNWEGSEDDWLELLYRIQSVGWLKGSQTVRSAPTLNMERDVPQILQQMSAQKRALLADQQGFYLASTGFSHETVEELAALAASIHALQQRHARLLRNNLRSNASGWAAVDAAANGQLGFWPLQTGAQTFILIAGGIPDFNNQSFVDLAWWLMRRYASSDDLSFI